MIGIDISEDAVGFFHCNRWAALLDLDGRGGGDEGDKGEFHLFGYFVFFGGAFVHGLRNMPFSKWAHFVEMIDEPNVVVVFHYFRSMLFGEPVT